LLRLVAGLLFASLAFQGVPLGLLAMLYLGAMLSDLLDGLLARRLHVESFVGRILDLVSDKSLTIVSLLYAAARGISMLPLAMIATREIIMIGLRLVTVEGMSAPV
jgi:phosphatidylglycerophosphate synthase